MMMWIQLKELWLTARDLPFKSTAKSTCVYWILPILPARKYRTGLHAPVLRKAVQFRRRDDAPVYVSKALA
jgi:hypothetical protein